MNTSKRITISLAFLTTLFVLSCSTELDNKNNLPTPILSQHPEWVELYNVAWMFAQSHVGEGTPENGLADKYMDEGFNPLIFQWDTEFMTMFGKYGIDSFPVMASLDNFYNKQLENGYICRVYWESDGTSPKDPNDPMINPPLFAWAEWQYYQITNDASRFNSILISLDKYYTWIKNNCRREETQLYFTSSLGSGMDNSPRNKEAYTWVDISSQQALSALYLSRIASVAGNSNLQRKYNHEYQELKQLINNKLWDEQDEIYYDLKADGSFSRIKTIASFWPLLAEIPNEKQAASLVSHLINPNEFWRNHVFPSVSADMQSKKDEEGVFYDPKGYYWRGGVWAPTNYMVIKGLEKYGYFDLSKKASENHIQNMFEIYSSFIPPASEVDEFGGGDGVKTIWECYSPDLPKPSTTGIPGNPFLSRQNFVGWSGLGPIALLIENVLGIHIDAPNNTIEWRISLTEKHGIKDIRFKNEKVSLVSEERNSESDRIVLTVDSDIKFKLKVIQNNKTHEVDIKSGNRKYSIGE